MIMTLICIWFGLARRIKTDQLQTPKTLSEAQEGVIQGITLLAYAITSIHDNMALTSHTGA